MDIAHLYMRMLCLPFLDSDGHPEGINAESDQAKQQPLDPVGKQLHGRPVEVHSVTIDDGVFGFPTINHTDGPWRADAKCAECDDDSDDLHAYKLKQSPIEP